VDHNFVFGFSAASLMFGFLMFGLSWHDDRSPEKLERDLQAYHSCLQDNRCLKDVEFYVQYYEIKWRLDDEKD
jgi:hypothetical protein